MAVNRSGKSVRISAATSPRRPCGLVIRATAKYLSSAGTPAALSGPSADGLGLARAEGQSPCLLQDFQRKPLFQLHPRGSEYGANGAGGPPLLADYFSEIRRVHFQFQDG